MADYHRSIQNRQEHRPTPQGRVAIRWRRTIVYRVYRRTKQITKWQNYDLARPARFVIAEVICHVRSVILADASLMAPSSG